MDVHESGNPRGAGRGSLRAICLVGLLVLAGCRTYADRLHEVRGLFYAGQLDAASAALDRHLQKGGPRADVLKLDRAVVELCAGRPRQAERMLREVRDSLDYLEQASLAETALAAMTDDTNAAYAGEDYEKILLRVFLALANLMGDGGDATAYALQVGDVQQRIIQAGADQTGENPKLAYQRVALGAYLYGALCEETHANYDDVLRSAATVLEWEPSFAFGPGDLQRAQSGRHSAAGHGVLYVLALAGRGPRKEEAEEMPSTAALLIADRVLSATGKHTLPPTIAPLKVPKLVVSPWVFRGVEVSVGGRPAGTTATITDVGRLAAGQYEAIYPRVLARAIVRRTLKKGVLYAGKEALGVVNDSLGNAAMDLSGIVWEATESADTRCWGLLPDRIQVLRLELPAGEHEIGLCPVGGRYGGGLRHAAKVEIADGRNTYLVANVPDDHVVGTILTSRP